MNCVQGNVLRFLPPLILSEAQVDEAMDVLARVMRTRFGGVPAEPQVETLALARKGRAGMIGSVGQVLERVVSGSARAVDGGRCCACGTRVRATGHRWCWCMD